MKLKDWIIIVLAGLFLLLWLFPGLFGGEGQAVEVDISELQSEQIMSVLRERGFVVAEGEAHANLLRRARDSDSWQRLLGDARDANAGLLNQIEALNGRLLFLADARAVAENDVAVQAALFGDSIKAMQAMAQHVDSVIAPIDDGFLTGRMAFFPPQRLGIQYRAEVPFTVFPVERPDNTLLLNFASQNPNVDLLVESFEYQLPQPEIIMQCGIGDRLRWFGGGALTGGLAGIFLTPGG